ncbi:MAG: hypothetical protein PHT48_02055 [Dechloromonas sp.]|nr:hypothetical protein [Dechloromonas sp.]
MTGNGFDRATGGARLADFCGACGGAAVTTGAAGAIGLGRAAGRSGIFSGAFLKNEKTMTTPQLGAWF